MRRVHRLALPAPDAAELKLLQLQVIAADDPAQEAAQRWEGKPERLFGVVRATLERMASGRQRCMYCEDSRGTDIEHFRPKARYPEVAFTWENYLLACAWCNSNRKREQFPTDPDSGTPLLIDPTSEEPTDHLLLSLRTGRFGHRTEKGRVSVEVFDLNSEQGREGGPGILPEGRADTCRKLRGLLMDLDQQAQRGDAAEVAAIKGTIQREPFSSVLVWMLHTAGVPDGRLLLGERIADILARYQVAAW